jgi:hypothetical protein
VVVLVCLRLAEEECWVSPPEVEGLGETMVREEVLLLELLVEEAREAVEPRGVQHSVVLRVAGHRVLQAEAVQLARVVA